MELAGGEAALAHHLEAAASHIEGSVDGLTRGVVELRPHPQGDPGIREEGGISVIVEP